MESLYYTLISILFTLFVGSTGYCLYGDGPDCAFQCHCANKAECTTGCQPTGCATGPLDIPWQGPGCQIGNVALGKMANQTGGYRDWIASKAVDGRLPGGGVSEEDVCAHPAVPQGQLAEWGVDLGGIYDISSVIIYNRLACLRCRDRTTMFTIGIRNSSNYEECYDDNSSSQPDYQISLTCDKPVIGRYIRFARKLGGFQSNVMGFCEFIAIGHHYLDCSVLQCVAGTGCSEVTGCEQCTGFYQPDCLTSCEAGFYGINCQSRCGHCAGDNVCDKTTGHCPDGCQLWWAEDRCRDNIVSPVFDKEVAFVYETESSYIKIVWQPVSVPFQLSQFYGYTVFYRKSSETKFTHGPDVPHTLNPQVAITGLLYNTEYHFEIRPYREMMGQREYGPVNLELTSKTKCGEPDSTEINLMETVFGEDSLDHSINVIFSPLTSLNSRCDYISHVLIRYKLENESKYRSISVNLTATSLMIPDLQEGDYVVTITVTNNQNMTSTSEPYYWTLGTTQVPTITSTMPGDINKPADERRNTAIIASLVALVVILAVVVSVTVGILLRRKKQKGAHNQTDIPTRSDGQLSPDSRGPAPMTADLTDEVPLDDVAYENIDRDYENIPETGQQYSGNNIGPDNLAVQLDEAGYTHLRK